MAATDLVDGTTMPFRSGAIEGFLIRRGSQIAALSAVCTHMGCVLNYSMLRERFECPCHGVTFDIDGQPTSRYGNPLPALPALQVRIEQGQIEVYTV
jgi:cytochrome b6-f complex iron-sulfur subunit